MAITASAVLAQCAKIYMNDSAQVLWTDAILLPYLTAANEDLALELEVSEIAVQRDVVSPDIDVAANAVKLAQLPVDMIVPLELLERADASTEDWTPVKEVDFVNPNLDTNSEIVEWSWRDLDIQINPPTSARDVRLRYVRLLVALTVAGSTVEIESAKRYLSARTAQLACYGGGNNSKKGDKLQNDVDQALDRVLRVYVNNQQGVSVRRRAYVGKRL